MGYTSKMIQDAIGKPCAVCDNYISEEIAMIEDFQIIQTKRKEKLYVHNCCIQEYTRGKGRQQNKTAII